MTAPRHPQAPVWGSHSVTLPEARCMSIRVPPIGCVTCLATQTGPNPTGISCYAGQRLQHACMYLLLGLDIDQPVQRA